MSLLLEVALLSSGFGLAAERRVEAERAIERARYEFVIGASQPFNDAYPRAVFEKRVERERVEERVLERVFGLHPTAELLAREFDRIEATSKAPEQWAAIKEALKNDRRLIEEAFCRPLLVRRALRARFAFDQRIHAPTHQKAREARSALLAGRDVPGAVVMRLSRRNRPPPTTQELLDEAKSAASRTQVVSAVEQPSRDEPIPVEVELAALLEKQFRRPGDVTTILEEVGCFEIFRLIEATELAWKVEAVQVPKVDFETWMTRVSAEPLKHR